LRGVRDWCVRAEHPRTPPDTPKRGPEYPGPPTGPTASMCRPVSRTSPQCLLVIIGATPERAADRHHHWHQPTDGWRVSAAGRDHRNPRPASIGTGGRVRSGSQADFLGMRIPGLNLSRGGVAGTKLMKLAISPGIVHGIIADNDARVALKRPAAKRGGNPGLSLPRRGKAQTIPKQMVVISKHHHLRSV
jgi:hypothetical protein